MSAAPVCPACARTCELTNGFEVYPRRPDLIETPFWICRGCSARVGCHPGSTRPLGTPASSAVRRARQMLHNFMLDPLWRDASRDFGPPGMRRSRTYRYLGEMLGIPRERVHVGSFDLETCRRAWRALRGVTYEQIHARREAQKRAEAGP